MKPPLAISVPIFDSGEVNQYTEVLVRITNQTINVYHGGDLLASVGLHSGVLEGLIYDRDPDSYPKGHVRWSPDELKRA